MGRLGSRHDKKIASGSLLAPEAVKHDLPTKNWRWRVPLPRVELNNRAYPPSRWPRMWPIDARAPSRHGEGEKEIYLHESVQRRGELDGIGSWGVPRPSLAHYVTGMGPMDGGTAAGGRSCYLSSRSNRYDRLLRVITQFPVQLLWLPFLFQNQNQDVG